jgi:hypothetical protein
LKALAILLVLANSITFAWWNGFFVTWLGDGREPARMASQIAATNAKLVDVARLQAAPTAVAPVLALCVEYPASVDVKAAELEKQIRALATERSATLKLDKEPSSEGGNYLVFLAISPTQKEAQRKLFELKRVGVEDVAMINDGELKWAISLGVFGTEEAAKARIQQLSRLGIPGAKTNGRTAVVNKVGMKARVSEADMKSALLALSATINAEAKLCQA